MDDKKTAKNATDFFCEFCDFKCCKKSDFDRHLLTRKHSMITNGDEKAQKNAEKFTCECGKLYKCRQSLWRHKKNCGLQIKEQEQEQKQEKQLNNEIFNFLLKENQEFKKMLIEQNQKNQELMVELAKKSGSINGNNNNNCNNTNKFNMNFFLNEKCKDAMNIMDFVDSIKLTLQDLEKTAEVGYVKGLTNIIVKGLNELDVHKRPIHCSDSKRETLYVKDNNAWEKENAEKIRVKNMVKYISRRNAKQINEWTKENKGYNDSSSKKNDKYLKLIIEANGGDDDEINKIITNVAPHIVIDKQSE